ERWRAANHARRLLGTIVAAEQPGRQDRRASEAPGDTVHGARELLAADRGGIEQRQLAACLRTEGGRRDADEPHRLHQPLARQQHGRPPVDLQPVLRRIAGVTARQRAEVGPAELQRHAAGGQALGAQLARHALGLVAQGLLEPRGLAAVALERRLGAHRLGRREWLHGALVAAEGEVEQVRPVRPLIARTASYGGPHSVSVPVRSMKASSTETGSTSGENSPRIAMTSADTRTYLSMSTGR